MGVDVFWSKGNNSYHFSYKTQKYWYFIKSFPNTKGGMNKIQIMMIINRPLNWTLDPCISSKVPKDHATIKLEGLNLYIYLLIMCLNKYNDPKNKLKFAITDQNSKRNPTKNKMKNIHVLVQV